MFALPASADIVAFDVPPQAGNDNGQCTIADETVECSYGLDFDVNAAIWVTGVGVFDPFAYMNPVPGLKGPLSVAIYDRNTESQVEGTFYTFPEGTTGPLIGGNLIHQLSEYIYLPIGNYSVVAWGYSQEQPNGNSACDGGACGGSTEPITYTVNNGGGIITFRGSRFGGKAQYPTVVNTYRGSRFGISGDFPTNLDDVETNQYLAGTFTYIPVEEEQQPDTPAVPEPATLALVGPAVLGLIRKLKRS